MRDRGPAVPPIRGHHRTPKITRDASPAPAQTAPPMSPLRSATSTASAALGTARGTVAPTSLKGLDRKKSPLRHPSQFAVAVSAYRWYQKSPIPEREVQPLQFLLLSDAPLHPVLCRPRKERLVRAGLHLIRGQTPTTARPDRTRSRTSPGPWMRHRKRTNLGYISSEDEDGTPRDRRRLCFPEPSPHQKGYRVENGATRFEPPASLVVEPEHGAGAVGDEIAVPCRRAGFAGQRASR